jgi:hypothetical protein
MAVGIPLLVECKDTGHSGVLHGGKAGKMLPGLKNARESEVKPCLKP